VRRGASTSIARCAMSGAVSGSVAIAMRTGSRRRFCASASTAGGKVAERRSVCRRAGSRDDARELVGKAEREQVLRLVEHHRAHGAERDGVVRDEIEQPAGRGDEDVRAEPTHRAAQHGRNRRHLNRRRRLVAFFRERAQQRHGELKRGKGHAGRGETGAASLRTSRQSPR
jgi:hypothetical protein